MKKLLTVAFLFITIGLSAQTTIEQLKNKKWIARVNNGRDRYYEKMMIFTDSICKRGNLFYRYYLSNSKENMFKENKIGKKKSGKYIVFEITHNPKYLPNSNIKVRTASTHRIIKISDKELNLVSADIYKKWPEDKKFWGKTFYFYYKNEGYVPDEKVKKKYVEFE